VRTGVGSNANTNATTTRYAYDALGRRISKSTQRDQQHNTTTFYWNGDVLLGEINEGVSNTSSVGNTKPSRTYLFEPFSFKPLALVQNGEVFHYHTDHIGTPREITNARAELVWSSTFKTYGALAVAHVNEVDNPLRFQGQYHDEETGLHYNRHRYYDPNCGQFTTQDPIGLLGGMNAYQYAPNPMTWVDPWGLSGKEGCSLQLYWPPNRGFARAPVSQTLPEGYEISRYGGFVDESGKFRDYGTFVAPKDVPYPMRALPPGTDNRPLSVYKVVKEIPDVPSGPAAPYFGELGGGIQHELPLPIQKYIDSGHIEVISRKIPGG